MSIIRAFSKADCRWPLAAVDQLWFEVGILAFAVMPGIACQSYGSTDGRPGKCRQINAQAQTHIWLPTVWRYCRLRMGATSCRSRWRDDGLWSCRTLLRWKLTQVLMMAAKWLQKRCFMGHKKAAGNIPAAFLDTYSTQNPSVNCYALA